MALNKTAAVPAGDTTTTSTSSCLLAHVDDSFGKGEGVKCPGRHDLVLGRGGESNTHSGNCKFRGIIETWKPLYRTAPRSQKQQIVRSIVLNWRGLDPPGRFLTKIKDKDSQTPAKAPLYYDVGDEVAKKRTAKSLSERIKNKWSQTGIQALTVKPVSISTASLSPTSSSLTPAPVQQAPSSLQSVRHPPPPPPPPPGNNENNPCGASTNNTLELLLGNCRGTANRSKQPSPPKAQQTLPLPGPDEEELLLQHDDHELLQHFEMNFVFSRGGPKKPRMSRLQQQPQKQLQQIKGTDNDIPSAAELADDFP